MAGWKGDAADVGDQPTLTRPAGHPQVSISRCPVSGEETSGGRLLLKDLSQPVHHGSGSCEVQTKTGKMQFGDSFSHRTSFSGQAPIPSILTTALVLCRTSLFPHTGHLFGTGGTDASIISDIGADPTFGTNLENLPTRRSGSFGQRKTMQTWIWPQVKARHEKRMSAQRPCPGHGVCMTRWRLCVQPLRFACYYSRVHRAVGRECRGSKRCDSRSRGPDRNFFNQKEESGTLIRAALGLSMETRGGPRLDRWGQALHDGALSPCR